MSPFTDMGRILSRVYAQSRRTAEAQPPDSPCLVGGLWSAFNFEDAAAKYKRQIEEQYGFLHILGHHKPVPLEGVFTDVYLYEQPLALRRTGLEDLEARFRRDQVEHEGVRREDGLSLIQKERRLMILGQPGAGKTTFLKHIALQAARGILPGIPIFISLKAVGDSKKSILDFMILEMQICGFPEPHNFLQLMLQSGQMLILLDGLDEVSREQESDLNLVQSIENLARQYSKNHFLITCRTAVSDYQFSGFTVVEMTEFSLEQIEAFILKWFQYEPMLGDSCRNDLDLPQHESLLDLARTPLLLNLLCLTYEALGHFPQRRVELYEEALNALLVKWDSSRRIRRDDTYRQLSLGRKRQLLAQIAAKTFTKGHYFIPKAEIIRDILEFLRMIPEISGIDDDDGEVILHAIESQHGILVERAKGVYSFVHLTFQEYLTAKYFSEIGPESWATLIPNCTESQWREVFLLTASLLNKADDFLQQVASYLDRLIVRDFPLLALLNHVDQKARLTSQSTAELVLQRSLYLHLILEIDDDLIAVRHFAVTGELDIDDDNFDALVARSFASETALDIAFGIVQDRDRVLARTLNSDYDLAIIRRYLNSESGPDIGIAEAFDLDLDLARDLELTLELDSDPGLDLETLLTRTRAHALNTDISQGLAQSLAFTFALARDFDSPIALDYALLYHWIYFSYIPIRPLTKLVELIGNLSHKQGLSSLQRSLAGLLTPSEESTRLQHKQAANALWQIIQQERHVQVFKLTKEQNQALATYLTGVELLLQCLNLAAVKDRDAILSRLLAPPAAASTA